MRLVEATLYALRIPFVEAFSHSVTERRWSDSVVVRVRDEVGTEGFGEGTPRAYVTGETVETMLEHLVHDLWPRVAGRELPPAGHLAGQRCQSHLGLTQQQPAEQELAIGGQGRVGEGGGQRLDKGLHGRYHGPHEGFPPGRSPSVKH